MTTTRLSSGPYDPLAARVCKEVQATGAVVVVIGGNAGDGYSIQAEASVWMKLPAILRQVADRLDATGARA